MTFYVENETDETFSNGENSFPIEETVEQVATGGSGYGGMSL